MIRILQPGPWGDRVFTSIALTMLVVVVFMLGVAANQVRLLLLSRKRSQEAQQ